MSTNLLLKAASLKAKANKQYLFRSFVLPAMVALVAVPCCRHSASRGAKVAGSTQAQVFCVAAVGAAGDAGYGRLIL